MKVKCIDNSYAIIDLTKGKVYEVLSDSSVNMYEIINDNGKKGAYLKNRFKKVHGNSKEAKNG